MIDYLERLFVPEEPDGAEDQEVEFRFSALEEESAREMVLPRMETEILGEHREAAERTAPEQSFVPRSSAESIPPVELARVYGAGEEPLFDERTVPIVARTRGQEPQESLERRLRRDSRRYDSGFFWY